MSDVEKIRAHLEAVNPLVNALVVEISLRPQGEDGDQALRFYVPRPSGVQWPVIGETILPAEALAAEDAEDRDYLLCMEVGRFAEMFAASLAICLRREKRPLEVVDTYEPERRVSPMHFQCGDEVNLQGYRGMVVALDYDSGDVTVRAEP